MITPPRYIGFEVKKKSSLEEWDKFNKKLQDTPKTTYTQETMEYQTTLHVCKNIESEPMDEKATTSQ